jgi:hypothetical protein
LGSGWLLLLLLRWRRLRTEERVLHSVREPNEHVAHGHVGGEELLGGDHPRARQSVEGVAHGAAVGVGLVADAAVRRRFLARTGLSVRRLGILKSHHTKHLLAVFLYFFQFGFV